MKEIYISLAVILSAVATLATTKTLNYKYTKTVLETSDFEPKDFNEALERAERTPLSHTRIGEENLFDIKRGLVDDDDTDTVEAAPDEDHNFILRGIVGIGERSAVILNFSKPKTTIRKPTSRAPVRSSSKSTNTDKVFKLGDTVKYTVNEVVTDTGYTVAEVHSSEVILKHSSGKELSLVFEDNDISQQQKELGYKTAIAQQKQNEQSIKKISTTNTNKPPIPPKAVVEKPSSAPKDKTVKEPEKKKTLTKEEKLKALKELQEKHKKKKKK